MENSGIYQIRNIKNNKNYIGSAVHIRKRWEVHRSLLRAKKHSNKHLQSAWNKYGEKAFIFSVLEKVPKKRLLQREQIWIDKLNVSDSKKGYNLSPSASSNLGFRHTLETRKKMSVSAKRVGTGLWSFGRKLSKATKRKIGIANKGNKPWCYGLKGKFPTNIRKNMSAAAIKRCQRDGSPWEYCQKLKEGC